MRTLTSALLAALTLSACTGISPGLRENNANRLAFPVFMIPRDVPAGPFTLKGYERAHERGGMADLYIEGSDNVMVDGTRFEVDPTPKAPIGLQLAAMDPAKNVIYLARPCQYRLGMKGAEECPVKYLTTDMFSPDVISAYNAALDEIKARYKLTGFNIVGFGSGGGLATILAGQRADIKTLRTVAGLLDTQTYSLAHNLTGYDQSFNPIDSVPNLINKPQHHYIAQFDQVIPNAVYHSYAQAFANDRCIGYTFIQNVDHNYDWSENWAAFVKDPVTCIGPNPDDAEREARKRVYAPQIGPKK